MIHIRLHMYPPMRYTGGLSYAEKFDSVLHFFIPKEKVEKIRKDGEKTDRGEPEASMTSFFSSFLWGLPAPPRAPRPGQRTPPEGCLASVASKRKRKKEAYPPADTSLQEFAHRYIYL